MAYRNTGYDFDVGFVATKEQLRNKKKMMVNQVLRIAQPAYCNLYKRLLRHPYFLSTRVISCTRSKWLLFNVASFKPFAKAVAAINMSAISISLLSAFSCL